MCVCVNRASQTLTDEQSAWVKQTNERVLKILRETPPDGQLFAETVTVCQPTLIQFLIDMCSSYFI